MAETTTGFSAKKSCARRRTAETHPFHEDEKGETFMHVSLLPTSLNQPRIRFYSTDLWSWSEKHHSQPASRP